MQAESRLIPVPYILRIYNPLLGDGVEISFVEEFAGLGSVLAITQGFDETFILGGIVRGETTGKADYILGIHFFFVAKWPLCGDGAVFLVNRDDLEARTLAKDLNGFIEVHN